MDLSFWVGFFAGGAVAYVVIDLLKAGSSNDLSKRLHKCSIEVARMGAERDLSKYSDKELIRAIANGLEPLTRGDDGAGGVH